MPLSLNVHEGMWKNYADDVVFTARLEETLSQSVATERTFVEKRSFATLWSHTPLFQLIHINIDISFDFHKSQSNFAFTKQKEMTFSDYRFLKI